MINVPAATPATSGKNRGNVQSYEWPTAIKTEDNTSGLPVNAKGKVTVTIAGDSFEVRQFETYAEVRETVGEHYESAALELFNAKLHSGQVNGARQAFAKLTAAPLDIVAYVRERVAAFDLSTFFAPVVRASGAAKQPKGVRAELANIANAAESMSKEDLLAAILALSAKTK
jgi:hypothetical protein